MRQNYYIKTAETLKWRIISKAKKVKLSVNKNTMPACCLQQLGTQWATKMGHGNSISAVISFTKT